MIGLIKALEFLQESNGTLSSNRLLFIIWILGVLSVWIVLCLKSGTLLEIPDSVTAITGIIITGKVTQKFAEK